MSVGVTTQKKTSYHFGPVTVVIKTKEVNLNQLILCFQPIKDGELPPHDALENILPDYQYIFTDPQQRAPSPGQQLARLGDSPTLQ